MQYKSETPVRQAGKEKKIQEDTEINAGTV
jgi:hypothetical protein